MAISSQIEWTEATWNPVTGCTKVSPGCRHCYAERMALRLRGTGLAKYKNGFRPTVHAGIARQPLSWRRPRMVFVCSMGDLFHDDVPVSFIQRVFETMREATWHQFQVLTKRAERLAALSESLSWPRNVWAGVTVETRDFVHRIDCLRRTGAPLKFISLEPLLGPIPDLDLDEIDWAIVGGESGPGSRPLTVDWVRDVRQTCLEADVPFFFKQWGGMFRKRNGRDLDGRTWDEMPVPLARVDATGPSDDAPAPSGGQGT